MDRHPIFEKIRVLLAREKASDNDNGVGSLKYLPHIPNRIEIELNSLHMAQCIELTLAI